MIRTVLGDIEPHALGFTYSHEHLIGSPPQWAADDDPDLVILEEDMAIEEARIAKRAGVRAIYEASPWDYGRNPEGLRRIAEETGIHIIGCAGFNKGRWFDPLLADWPIERIQEQIVTDVAEGMDSTDVQGGVIKYGTGYNHISDVEERVIRAAARAHRQTGAPLHGHTETGTMPIEQLDILEEEGADLSRVGIVHIARNPDRWLHKELARRGAYLVYDGFSKIKYFPDSARSAAIIDVIDAGYEDRVLVGGDLARKSDLTSYTGGPGLGYIAGKWLPRFRQELAERGNSTERIDEICNKIFVTNPARYFDMITPY